MPGVKIHYKISQNTEKILKHGIKMSKKLFSTAGADIVSSFAPIKNTGWHTAGTVRMGDDPNTSVVNKYGQAHQVKNLFIVDSSVFVTAGAVNPVATAQAVTLFSCNYIINNIDNIVTRS
jgi:choline dehydrogenase-like flavoprotein